MKKIKVAINGCGRIGRAFLKLAVKRSELEVVAVNDLGDIKDIAYLLNYDSVYGQSGLGARADGEELVVDGKKVAYLSEKDPVALPWAKFGSSPGVTETFFISPPVSLTLRLMARS